MEKYQRIDNGQATTVDDPKRGIWYSAHCGFWTDDWTTLKAMPVGIPCCPDCGCPGMQTNAEDWHGGADRFQAEGNPRYTEFLALRKEKCGGRGFGFMSAYKDWLEHA